jgi:hypothetical protein
MSKKLTQEEYIEKVRFIHNNSYEYSKTIYTGNKNKLIITCIEYDGKQHFESIEYFGSEESLKKKKIKDFIKDNFCLKNKINLIRIPYYDFDKIEKIIEEICQ